jgi:hypothetical protein
LTIDPRSLFAYQPGAKNNPRDVAVFLMRKEACMKMSDVADAFFLSRTSASSAMSRVRKRLPREANFGDEMNEMRTAIQANRSAVKMTR